MKKRNNKFEKYLLLSWRKTAIGLMAWIIAVFFHNLIYALFTKTWGIEFEEPVFFTIAVILIPLYFLISIIYTIFKKLRK